MPAVSPGKSQYKGQGACVTQRLPAERPMCVDQAPSRVTQSGSGVAVPTALRQIALKIYRSWPILVIMGQEDRVVRLSKRGDTMGWEPASRKVAKSRFTAIYR